MKLFNQRWYAAENLGVTQLRVNGTICLDKVLPGIWGDQLHLFRQRQPAATPKEIARLAIKPMRLHYVRKGRLDQRVAVHKCPVEIKNDAPRMAVAARREDG